MAINTTYIVSPVFTATEVIVLFFTGVTAEAGFRSLFRRFVLERDYLCRIAFLYVGFAGTVTRLTAGYFALPAADLPEGGMRSM